jgi:hypothetical protein
VLTRKARNGSPNGAGAVRRTAGWHHHTWWIIARERAGGRLEALTVRRPDGPREEALAVFGFAEEAGLYLRLGGLEGDGWRVRESGPGEVASVLLDPCAGAKRVALDPLPETAADGALDLVSLDKKRFLALLLGENAPDRLRMVSRGRRS